MAEGLRRRLARRAIVFSTGAEVASGRIEDTNAPLVAARLAAAGYAVARGPALPDDERRIAAALRRAVLDDGHGLVVTTGGVGAEDKDRTVEALLCLDPAAATPAIAHFAQGHGRHVKDRVRIAVARFEHALLVALPGPTDEVRAGLDALLAGLARGLPPPELAQAIARALREQLAARQAAPAHGR